MEIWSEFIKQAPYISALVFLVVKAMAHLKERDLIYMRHTEERDRQFQSVITHIGDDCHTVQQAATEAMKENTAILGRVSGALDRFERTA